MTDTTRMTIVVAAFLTIVVLLVARLRPQFRYNAPYALHAATSRAKWRWAAILTVWAVAPFLLIGLVEPVINTEREQWPAFPLAWSGLCLVVAVPVLFATRYQLERRLRMYRRMSALIRSRHHAKALQISRRVWRLAGPEYERFVREGYSTDFQRADDQ